MLRDKDEGADKSLKSTLSDWFIHEARNALGVFFVEGLDIEWTPKDYERQRDIIKRFARNMEERPQAHRVTGNLPVSKIKAFVDEATRERWNKSRVEVLKQEFDQLVGENEVDG